MTNKNLVSGLKVSVHGNINKESQSLAARGAARHGLAAHGEARLGTAREGAGDNSCPFISESGVFLSAGLDDRDVASFALFVKGVDNRGRTVTAVISSGEIDRDGEIIDPAAIEAAWPSFMRNPVLLAAHQHRLSDGKSPVIGKILSGKRSGNEFIAEVQFSTTPLAEEYWTLYRDKTQRAFSIGFIGKKWETQVIDGQRVKVWVEIELLELSAVPVPSNRDALSKSAAKKQAFVEAKKLEAEEEEYDEWEEFVEKHWDESVAEFGEEYTAQSLCSREELNRHAQEWIDRIFLGDKNGRLPGEKSCIIAQCYSLNNKFLDAYHEGMELVDDVQRVEKEPDKECPDFVNMVLPDFVDLVRGKR
jgi:hypothetical protein